MSLIHACGHLRSLPMYHIYKHYNKKQKKKNKITRLFSIPLLFHFHQLWLMCKNIRNSNYIERKTQFLCYICCFFFLLFFPCSLYNIFTVQCRLKFHLLYDDDWWDSSCIQKPNNNNYTAHGTPNTALPPPPSEIVRNFCISLSHSRRSQRCGK